MEFQSDILVINAITEGDRPQKPERAALLGFSDELWGTIELCWLEDRDARPCIGDIHSSLNEATAFWYMRDFQPAMREPDSMHTCRRSCLHLLFLYVPPATCLLYAIGLCITAPDFREPGYPRNTSCGVTVGLICDLSNRRGIPRSRVGLIFQTPRINIQPTTRLPDRHRHPPPKYLAGSRSLVIIHCAH